MTDADRIALLAADIEDELAKLEKLRREYTKLRERIDIGADEADSYDKAVVGYYLHNFYNGCENVFRSITRFFENDLGPGSWHTDLLKRMKLEIPGYRPSVIDADLYALLDDFRAFRHRFRHLYTFELNWAREKIVAGAFDQAYGLFVKQVRRFVVRLRENSAPEAD